MACEFFEKLSARWAQGARACVGLDPDFSTLPTCFKNRGVLDGIFSFNKLVMQETAEQALAWKPNLAFYLCHGHKGLLALEQTFLFGRSIAPGTPMVIDGKFGDIGNTSKQYAEFAFETLGANAATVSPYVGQSGLQPFLDYSDRGTIVLAKTSNKGGGEFQDRSICLTQKEVVRFGRWMERHSLPSEECAQRNTIPLHQFVAWRVWEAWNERGNCSLVAGATYPEELAAIRAIVEDMWLLIPGIGKQAGDLLKTVRNGLFAEGSGILINSSSGITTAKSPRQALATLTDGINAALAEK